MLVERRGAGRWRRDDQIDGRTTGGSAREGYTRAGEILLRWGWVESRVWTPRMLTALEQGVKGGKWFSLIDKVHPERTLLAAFSQVAANKGAPGVDHVTVTMFDERLEENLRTLSEDLRTDHYRPQQIRRHYIPKPGSKEMRPLGIPTVRDRVAQTAVRMVIEPIFEHEFAAHSYGFRPGRGCKDALRYSGPPKVDHPGHLHLLKLFPFQPP